MLTRLKFELYHCEFRYIRLGIIITLVGLVCGLVGTAVYKKYRLQEIQCLAMNIYHEARGESLEGRRAVAIVTMNRVVSKDFPDTVCEVVYQRRIKRSLYFGEFSWTQDQVTDIPTESSAWKESMTLARSVYLQYPDMEQLDGAIYYHATFLNPYWAPVKTRVQQIGNHVFYR